MHFESPIRRPLKPTTAAGFAETLSRGQPHWTQLLYFHKFKSGAEMRCLRAMAGLGVKKDTWDFRSLVQWPGRLALAALLALLLAGCATAPPSRPDNLCAIFQEKPAWWKAAKKAERKWRLPVPVGMAFIHRESSFRSDAKPPRKRFLGVLPGRRSSSAFGYAQATDEAWKDYRKATGARFAERDDIADALDFIGWYNDRSHRKLGIAKNDAYRLYLAYYSGPGGYARGTWRGNSAVQGYAKKVVDRTKRYSNQLGRCEGRLKKRWWWF